MRYLQILKKLIQKTVLQYFQLYHAQYFPLIHKDKIYKQVSTNLFLLRVGNYSSPGDILGYLTQKLNLSKRDTLYCIPIDESLSDRISEKTENKFGYIYDKTLEELNDNDIINSQLPYKLTNTIYYLAHYFYMLENQKKSGPIALNSAKYSLIDSYAQWQSEKKYGDEYSIDKWNRGKRNQKLVYTRFLYEDLLADTEFQDKPILEASKILGFDIRFMIGSKVVNFVDEKVFNDKSNLVQLIFSGSVEWKEKIAFDINLNLYNKMLENTLGGDSMMIYEKPNYHTLN